MASKKGQQPENDSRVGKSDNFKLWTAIIFSLILAYFVTTWLNARQDDFSEVNFEIHSNKSSNVQKYFVQDPAGLDSSVNVRKVLDLLGWQQVENLQDSDLMWFQDYPFNTFAAQMKSLKPHQRVNHFPGSGYVTSKALMTRTVKSDHIPKAFYPLQDAVIMAEYFAANPKKMFVEKSISNRGVKIKALKDINMTDPYLFIQEFVENPLLLDGHMFDIGLRVVITSIDPIRLYIHDDEMVIRFCLDKYHPFDPSKMQKYVVHDGQPFGDYYLPIIGRHREQNKFSLKAAFEAVLTNQGIDPQTIFKQMEDIIVDVYQQQELELIEATKKFSSKFNFFEFVRFDFIIDDKLKVHLMEVNMSPSMMLPNRQKIYYQVLNLIGRSNYIEDLLAGDDNTMVESFVCSFKPCNETCEFLECSLCYPCLSKNDEFEILSAHRENTHKGVFRRLIPSRQHFNEEVMVKMSPKNRMMTKWFQKKCNKNQEWC